eukprot:CAMPEP_0194315876 /NCGR_PEP_ID=MMETSP0171-20130528/12666_1 /TAXON_ID=218684 /ORGANISM="Corethron pennatum, Strain L29A3" /LENGTH=210 /DNA_ID=CAMNT_0039071871 /DNA_START=160 /DNA_END=788 /DNA_ORIENTATION=+
MTFFQRKKKLSLGRSARDASSSPDMVLSVSTRTTASPRSFLCKSDMPASRLRTRTLSIVGSHLSLCSSLAASQQPPHQATTDFADLLKVPRHEDAGPCSSLAAASPHRHRAAPSPSPLPLRVSDAEGNGPASTGRFQEASGDLRDALAVIVQTSRDNGRADATDGAACGLPTDVERLVRSAHAFAHDVAPLLASGWDGGEQRVNAGVAAT